MAELAVSPSQLVRLVRGALMHLYDYAYLETHPLATMVDADRSLDRVTRAQRLRRLLLDCIDEIKPRPDDPSFEADRVHAILTYRYVDGLPMDRVAQKRGLGERQAYRELRKGVRAVAGLLYDRLREQGANLLALTPSGTGPPVDLANPAEAEVARLRQAASLEPLDLQELLAGVLTLLVPLGERSGIRIHVSSAGRWPPVFAHRVMLRQALLNLLRHALDALGSGDLTIHISARPRALRLDVVGSRVPGAPSPRAAETDVGLTVARALLEAQGGHLEAGWHGGEWRAEIGIPTAGQATVLVIDDNADLVALMQRYLAGHEVTVIGATNAEEALRLAADIRPQLIILDVMMPDQDGWEVLQGLKASVVTGDIPVVICSVLNEVRLAEAMGASGYITKPVSQVDLLQLLTRWLGPLQPTASTP